MDYTDFPRELMYKEKASLQDFGVSNEMTIEHIFYEGLLKRPSINNCFRKRETILRIFNNAYYLCTLILMDEDPRLTIDYYREIAENTERTIDWVNHFAPMTMALVYLEMKGCRQECACGVRIFDEFLEKDIYEHYLNWDTKGASEGKADFYELAGNDYPQIVNLPSDFPSFPPRPITIKSINEVFDNNGYSHSLRHFTHDYDMERIAEIFRFLGRRTKEEKEALRDALKWDIECFCDEERKYRFLAQLDGMDFSSAEHAVEQGMEARYSRALLEMSFLEKKVHQLEKEIIQLKLKAQNAEDMLPTSEYHENMRDELSSVKEELESLQNSLEIYKEQELSSNEFIILFSNLFGVDLAPESINQSAFAKFLQALSGQKVSQSTISRMRDREETKNFTHKMKKDAVHLAKLLMEIPRNVANKKAEVIYKLIADIVRVYDLNWAADFKDMSAEKKDQFKEIFKDSTE